MLSKPGATTFNEINDQPQVWNQVLTLLNGRQEELQNWFREEKFGQVVLVGCGSSYYAALTGATVFHRLSGLNARALPGSEVLYSPRPPYDVRIKTLLIGVSRSGDTSETVWAVEKLKKLDPRLKVLTITCKAETDLGQLGHQSILLPFAMDEGPIATRSYTSTLLALQMLAGFTSGNQDFLAELARLPALFEMKKMAPEIQKAVSLKAAQVTFLGSGPFYGIAGASALVMREMTNMPTDFLQFLEFRHGSQGGMLPNTLVVAFSTDALRKAEEEVIREIAVMRGPRMLICSQADNKTKAGTEFVFEQGDLSEMGRLLLAATYGQVLAFYSAIGRGQNPDRPKHVHPVVKLKEPIGT